MCVPADFTGRDAEGALELSTKPGGAEEGLRAASKTTFAEYQATCERLRCVCPGP